MRLEAVFTKCLTGVFTLKVCHVCPDVRVQCVDDHLSVRRTCDLKSSVHQTWCGWCRSPCIVLADVCSLREEVKLDALVKLRLANLATLEECLAAGIESAVEDSKEDGSFLGEDLTSLIVKLPKNVDVLKDLLGIDWCRHGCNAPLITMIWGNLMVEERKNETSLLTEMLTLPLYTSEERQGLSWYAVAAEGARNVVHVAKINLPASDRGPAQRSSDVGKRDDFTCRDLASDM